MKEHTDRILNIIAKENGYKDKTDLLYDYNIIPSVRMPQHKKWEFPMLLLKHIKRKC